MSDKLPRRWWLCYLAGQTSRTPQHYEQRKAGNRQADVNRHCASCNSWQADNDLTANRTAISAGVSGVPHFGPVHQRSVHLQALDRQILPSLLLPKPRMEC